MKTKLLFLSVIFVLCGCRSVSEVEPTVIRDVDFRFETIWKAVCAACELQGFFGINECNKDDRSITTYYKILPEATVGDAWMRSNKALVKLVPKEGPTVKYDIQIRVGLYWKKRTLLPEAEEGWEFIKWDRELENQIVAEFHRQTAQDQRIRQGLEEPKKRTGREF
jgi:hypothetical protein